MLNVWTMLWQREDKKPYVYSTLPKKHPPVDTVEQRFYTPEEVIRFEKMLRKHIPDCKFRCLTNLEVPGVECIPLITKLEAWWPQVEIWRPDLPTEGRNLYCDLDVLLIRDIKVIVNIPAEFAIIHATKQLGGGVKPWIDKHNRWRYPGYQGSMKVWNHGATKRFWNAFDPVKHPKHYASDQDFLKHKFPHEKMIPGKWFLPIYICPEFPKDENVKAVLTYAMQNDKAAELYPWVREIW